MTLTVAQAALSHSSFNYGLNKKVEGDWDKRHQIVLHADADKIPSRKSAIGKTVFAPSRCMTLGFCACRDERGKHSVRFAAKLASKFRQVFKKNTMPRRSLDANLIVLRFDLLESESLSEENTGSGHGHGFYFHLGYANLKTWFFTLLPMAVDDRPPSRPGLVPLRLPNATEGFQGPCDHVVLAIHHFTKMDLLKPWSCRLFLLDRKHPRHFTDHERLQPDQVEIDCDPSAYVGFGHDGPDVFHWGGWDNEKPRNSGQRGPGKRKHGQSSGSKKKPTAKKHEEDEDNQEAAEVDGSQGDGDDVALLLDALAWSSDSEPDSEHLNLDDDAPNHDIDSVYSPSIAPREQPDSDSEGNGLQEALATLEHAEMQGLITSHPQDIEYVEAMAENGSINGADLDPQPDLARDLFEDFQQAQTDETPKPGPSGDVGKSIDGDDVSERTSDISITSDSNNNSGDDMPDSSSSSSKSESEHALRDEKVIDVRLESSPNGSIRYNHKTFNLVAHCSFHAGNCRRTRTSKPSFGRKNISGQGRPCGLLSAWLDQAAQFPDASSHSNDCRPTLEERRAARTKLMKLPGAPAFCQRYERPKREDEADEPDSMV